jgi:hypothetical protein
MDLEQEFQPKILLQRKLLLEKFRAGPGFGIFDVRKVGFLIFSSKKTEITGVPARRRSCVRKEWSNYM